MKKTIRGKKLTASQRKIVMQEGHDPHDWLYVGEEAVNEGEPNYVTGRLSKNIPVKRYMLIVHRVHGHTLKVEVN